MVYTYDGVKQEIKDKLSLLSNWRKTIFSGTYENIISAVAYAINRKCIYPAEVFYRESFLKTATKYSSVLPRAEYLSYNAHRKQGANGIALISKDDTFSDVYVYSGDSVLIPKWTEIIDATGNVQTYTTEDNTYYTLTTGNLEVNVKEGIPKIFYYISSGVVDEVFTIHSDSVDNDEITVHIVDSNGVVLNDVNICGIDIEETKLYFVNDLENYTCEVANAYDFESVDIKFGNDINTRKLNSGVRVMVRFADTKGVEGNITNTSTLATIKSTLIDSGNVTAELFVTNTEAISDGSDVESIESIIENSTNLFGTGYRCGGYQDWIKNLEAHSYVHKAIIWSTDDYADDTITNDQNKVFISAISADGDELTVTQKSTLTIDLLKDKKSPTEVVSWQPLNDVFAIFRFEGVVKNQSFPVISSQINTALTLIYGILNVDFKQDVNDSNFTKIIDAVDNVVKHSTEVYHLEKDFSYNSLSHTLLVSNTSSDESEFINQIYLQPNTFEIWVKYTGTTTPVKIAGDVSGTITEYNNTFVDILLGEEKKGTDSTGLVNDATVYTAEAEISALGGQAISITGSDAQTITELVTELNADLTDIIATFNEGDKYIRLSVDSIGDSTITFTDTDIVSTLFGGGATIDTPVAGKKYSVLNGNILYSTNTVSFTIDDLSATPPIDYELSIAYKTQDGLGEQANDIRFKSFDSVTNTDDDYNEYDMRYI